MNINKLMIQHEAIAPSPKTVIYEILMFRTRPSFDVTLISCHDEFYRNRQEPGAAPRSAAALTSVLHDL
ncbi:hypothetical protein EYF80_047529 [Liparis tanakae]|uniref:Uncharacterized protein n=1 Tax=Liparis tanakae TaxID=230148 RepID=A0A4Z2FMP6_9TELE|nr:hypothetical protein EYF80_047529 [Liparis tanakae]